MLMDSGHIQEQDVKYLNKKKKRKGEPPVDPIYTREDARKTLSHFIGVGLHRQFSVADGVSVTFYNAGHILGSASVQLDIQEHSTGKKWRVVFSGDLGRDEVAILNYGQAFKALHSQLYGPTYARSAHQGWCQPSPHLR